MKRLETQQDLKKRYTSTSKKEFKECNTRYLLFDAKKSKNIVGRVHEYIMLRMEGEVRTYKTEEMSNLIDKEGAVTGYLDIHRTRIKAKERWRNLFFNFTCESFLIKKTALLILKTNSSSLSITDIERGSIDLESFELANLMKHMTYEDIVYHIPKGSWCLRTSSQHASKLLPHRSHVVVFVVNDGIRISQTRFVMMEGLGWKILSGNFELGEEACICLVDIIGACLPAGWNWGQYWKYNARINVLQKIYRSA